MAIPSRQIDRYYYVVDLKTIPFVIRESDQRDCAERAEAVKPDIRYQRPPEKVIELYARDGRRLASHRPRGWFNTINIWNLNQNQWEMDYSLSPGGNHLAYRISERGMIDFSASTLSSLAYLTPGANQGLVF